MNIYGGDIKATGGNNATGIGSGNGKTGRVNIWGGIIDATSGSSSSAAAIGGGGSSYAYVYIYGGLVKAESRGSGMAIGAGNYSMGYVYISGGTVVPKPYTAYATSKSIGSTRNGFGEVRFTGGSINTTTNLVSPAATNGNGAAVWPVTVTGLKARSEIAIDGLPSDYGTKDIYADEAGEITLWLPNGDYVFTATDDDNVSRGHTVHVSDAPAVAAGFVLTGFTVNGTDVAYLSGEGWSYNGGSVDGVLTLSGLDHYELSGALTNKFLCISNSCTVAFSNVVFNSFNVAGLKGIVNIAGAYAVELALYGENAVTAPTGGNIAGILVPGGASLVIGGDGSLTASGSENAAGIGGTKQTASGSITVNGGTVTANGGNYAAGIGGGYDAGCGSITVNGGTVTANGGIQGAGIGGGAFTGGTSVGGTYAGDIAITGGVVVATGGNWAAGIGGGEQSSGGSVTVKGGRITAQGGVHGPAIGACGAEGTYGDVTISGGTVVAMTNEYSFAIGSGRDTASMGAVTITGGSVDAASYSVSPAPSNGVKVVSRVEVSGFAPGAAVAFNGLPDYYGTADIYADAGGCAYLWLPDDWTTPVTPKLMSASPRRMLGAGTGTSHTFSANGYSYTVEIPAGGGEAVAEKGDPLPLESLKIDDFAVEEDHILLRFTAKPATWLYGFSDLIKIRASETLPIPDDDSSLLDLSGAELYLEGSDAATIVVPRTSDAARFFRVEGRSP